MSAYASGQEALNAVAKKVGCKYEKILESDQFIPGESISDWIAIAAGCADTPVKTDTYLEGLEKYVSDTYAKEGGLHNVKATEWHRISLAVLALGGDPTNFGVNSFGEPINLIADGTYNWYMSESLGVQGLNGWIFALITLDAKYYEVPQDALYTREDIISEIVKAQTDEGGFGLAGGSPDVDITSMAIQALAPYYDKDINVQGSVDRAVWWLSAQQSANGDFASFGSGNSEATAQTIIALCSLGIDPRTDERFIKNDNSALDGLLHYQCENGMFKHEMEGMDDVMATEQAALALIALDRFDQKAERLYDMTYIAIREEVTSNDSGIGMGVVLGIIAVVAAAGAAVIVITKRGKKKSCMK